MNYAGAINIYCGKKVNFNPIGGEVLLENLGNDIEIKSWNVPGKTKPTIQVLEDLWASDGAAYEVQEIEDSKDFTKSAKDPVLVAALKVIMDELNTLRNEHGLANRTLSQLVNAVKTKM